MNSQQAEGAKSRRTTPQDALKQLIAIEGRARDLIAAGKRPGPVTGFHKLDTELGGYLAPGLHTFLAAPGAGKTAFALQIAAQCQCPCIYVTAEMPVVELMRRVISRTSRTFAGDLRGGALSPSVLETKGAAAIAAIPMLSLMDSTSQAVFAYEIREEAEALKAEHNSDHVLIIIDSVTDWALSVAMASQDATRPTEYQIMELALTSLKELAAHLSAPIICIAHKNRNSQNAQENLHSSKGTGRFEYVSESLWSLDPPKQDSPSNGYQKPLVLTLAKNRNGAKSGTVDFTFEGRLMEFKESGGLL